jgi:arylsulfatase A-like enzyme
MDARFRICLAGLLLAVADDDAAAAPERPNVLYLFTDDQSVRTLSCYADAPQAYTWAKTPNIDKLAEAGVRFRYCYTGPLCRPSRGTALTGRLACNRTNATPYWTTKLREQGYHTGMVGKWHWNVPQHGVAWDWSVVWPHHLGDRSGGYYVDQMVSINGGKLVPLGGYSTDRYTDYAVQYLKERAEQKDKPWYFWVCFAGVHGPYTPADRHLQDYVDAPPAEIPGDIFGPRPEKPENLHHFSRWKEGADGAPTMSMGGVERPFDAWVKQYNQAVRALDEGVGRIMQTLRDTGQLDNTIVIFTADQGFAWGQHGFRDKTAPYDANLCAPLIVSNPKRFAQGVVCAQPVSGADIIKTIHRATGLADVPTDGRDFTALLSNPDRKDWTDQPMLQMHGGTMSGNDAFIAALRKGRDTGNWDRLIAESSTGTRAWLMMRKGRYKYVRYLVPEYIEELYDLEADPLELTNLALRKANHAQLARLREQCVSAFAARGAAFLDLLPAPKILDEPPAAGDLPKPAKTRKKRKPARE